MYSLQTHQLFRSETRNPHGGLATVCLRVRHVALMRCLMANYVESLQIMQHFDGILGDRTDPLMQNLVELDKQIWARLFAHNSDSVHTHLKVLRDNYTPIRLNMFDYVKSLNDQALFDNQHQPLTSGP